MLRVKTFFYLLDHMVVELGVASFLKASPWSPWLIPILVAVSVMIDANGVYVGWQGSSDLMFHLVPEIASGAMLPSWSECV